MEITYHHGDLLESGCDIIAHQTNCQAKMGAGIAKQIHYTWPRVYTAYVQFCKQCRASGKSPLGSCQLVYTTEEKKQIVANLFGQEYYGRGKLQTDYDALRHAVHKLANNRFVRENKFSIGMPMNIGCALGGGDWNIVRQILEEEFADYPGLVQIWEF